MIRVRGSRVCVVHGSPRKKRSKRDRPKGTAIKCWPNTKAGRKKARGMHFAIMKSQGKV